MAAPKGNEYWKQVRQFVEGTQKKYEKPVDLLNEAEKYFEWSDANPLKEEQIIPKPWKELDKDGKLIKHHSHSIVLINHPRPYTISALCLFLGICEDTFSNYGKKEGYEVYFGVVRAIKQMMYSQKFEGAAVGMFNANIIARDLGLKDRSDVTSNDTEIDNNVTVEIVRKKKGK